MPSSSWQFLSLIERRTTMRLRSSNILFCFAAIYLIKQFWLFWAIFYFFVGRGRTQKYDNWNFFQFWIEGNNFFLLLSNNLLIFSNDTSWLLKYYFLLKIFYSFSQQTILQNINQPMNHFLLFSFQHLALNSIDWVLKFWTIGWKFDWGYSTACIIFSLQKLLMNR